MFCLLGREEVGVVRVGFWGDDLRPRAAAPASRGKRSAMEAYQLTKVEICASYSYVVVFAIDRDKNSFF